MEKIKFYKVLESGVPLPYGAFSNFSSHPFIVDGVRYLTSEHYYQSKKFLDEDDRQAVIDAPGPRKCAEIGRDPRRTIRPGWDMIRAGIMFDALKYKFEAYPDLKKLLLSTGDAEIIEDSP